MHSSTLPFVAGDGKSIHVHQWTPEVQAPRAVMVIAHGLAEHGARYAGIAPALTDAGLAVYAVDHRGHGKTADREEDVGFFAAEDGWNRVVQDLWELCEKVKGLHPGLPLVLLGHSMGSFLAQTLMYQHGEGFSAVILSGSNGKVGPLRLIGVGVTELEILRLGPRGRSALVHAMSFADFNRPFKPARTDFDWLSRDHATVDAYIADPRCGFRATVLLWNQFLKGLGELERPSNLAHIPKQLPVYVVSGREDPVSRQCRGLEWLLNAYSEQGLTQVAHRFYPEARHEILNETNREEVLRDLLQWLEPHLKGAKG